MRISNDLLHNFLRCKHKAYLKLQEPAGDRSDYESMTIQLDDSYRETSEYSAVCDALEKQEGESKLGSFHCIPVLLTWINVIIDAVLRVMMVVV